MLVIHRVYMPRSGPSKQSMRRHRSIQAAIEADCPAELLVEVNMRIAQRKCRVRIEQDEDGGEWFVTWDEDGIPPSDELVMRAINWLADRRDGTPAQSIHLAAHLHGRRDEAPLALGVIGAGALLAIRQALALPAPPVTDVSDAIDAEIVETTPTSQHDSCDASTSGIADPGDPSGQSDGKAL